MTGKIDKTDKIDPATTREQYVGWQRNIARNRFEGVVSSILRDPRQDRARELARATDDYGAALDKWGGMTGEKQWITQLH